MPIRQGITISEADAVEYDRLIQEGEKYDRLQYVYKIKLNSYYGALTNKYFRFFDLRMGESTTGTGRMILLHQCSEVCSILDGVYAPTDRALTDKTGRHHVGYSSDWSVVYGDTDSTYFTTKARTVEQAIEIADGVGELVNDSFPKFMRENFMCQDGYDQMIQTGREIVSDRGIFVDKKRYILHIVDDEGDKVDKLKVMGLDTKKTTLPKEVSKKLNGFVERYLKGESWDTIKVDVVNYKEQLRTTTDIMSIGLPKGVQNVEMYTAKYNEDRGTRLPGHVAASIFYNINLREFGDNASMPIISGMKVKVFYLTQPYGRFKNIAIPVDIDEVPEWFLTKYRVSMSAHLERLVDKPLGNIIKAIGKQVPSKQTLVNDDLLVY